MEYTETTAGLPNTCHDCGAGPLDIWYAPNDDVARAGGGKCAQCAGVTNGGILQPEDQAQEETKRRAPVGRPKKVR